MKQRPIQAISNQDTSHQSYCNNTAKITKALLISTRTTRSGICNALFIVKSGIQQQLYTGGDHGTRHPPFNSKASCNGYFAACRHVMQ